MLKAVLYFSSLLFACSILDACGVAGGKDQAVSPHPAVASTISQTVKAIAPGDTSGTNVDAQALPSPTNLSISPDTGVSASDGITASPRLVFAGKGKSGARVRVYLNEELIGSATVGDDGTWSFDDSKVALKDGKYRLRALQLDKAGDPSALSPDYSFVVDTQPPAVTTQLSMEPDTGLDGDGITASQNLVFSGDSPPRSWVNVYVNGKPIGTIQADGDGIWQLDYGAVTLADGHYQITARTMDTAGNLAPAGPPLQVQVDTTPPAPPVVTGFQTDTGMIGDNGVTSDTTLIVLGTAEPGSLVELIQDGEALGSTNTDASGHWRFDNTENPLTNGTYRFTAQATDVAGNTSKTSPAYHVTIKTG